MSSNKNRKPDTTKQHHDQSVSISVIINENDKTEWMAVGRAALFSLGLSYVRTLSKLAKQDNTAGLILIPKNHDGENLLAYLKRNNCQFEILINSTDLNINIDQLDTLKLRESDMQEASNLNATNTGCISNQLEEILPFNFLEKSVFR